MQIQLGNAPQYKDWLQIKGDGVKAMIKNAALLFQHK
jgi:hypothetical protein